MINQVHKVVECCQFATICETEARQKRLSTQQKNNVSPTTQCVCHHTFVVSQTVRHVLQDLKKPQVTSDSSCES